LVIRHWSNEENPMQPSQQSHDRPDRPEKCNPQPHPGDVPRQDASAEAPRISPAVAEPDDEAPYWLPRGDSWHRLSEPIRRAVHQRILPMWKELVDSAADELERSAAATLVHLSWLEMCGQVELEEARADSDPLTTKLLDPERLIARHLQLLAAKQRSAELLRKLRLAREKPAGRQSADPKSRRSPLFGDQPLGSRRCFRYVPNEPAATETHAEQSRASSVESPEPDDAGVEDRGQVSAGKVPGDSRAAPEPEPDRAAPPGISAKSTQGVADRQVWKADPRSREIDARQENREKEAQVQHTARKSGSTYVESPERKGFSGNDFGARAGS
jgi:hypothetical protein